MNARLKLKRGLSDISPLFSKEVLSEPRCRIVQPEQQVPPSHLSFMPEVCYIWSVEDEGDAHFLNNYFASKMLKPQTSSLLVALEEKNTAFSTDSGVETWSEGLRRMRIPFAQMQEELSQAQSSFQRFPEMTGGQVFLEVGMRSLYSHPELVGALDHLVLFLKPHVDAVTEAYRQLKRLMALQIRAEVTILFDTDNAGGAASELFELFSEFVSRRLSLSVSYLGALHLSRGGQGLHQDIRWEGWQVRQTSEFNSIEKIKFLSWIDKRSKEKAFS